jgi:serine/threonine-protein kinase
MMPADFSPGSSDARVAPGTRLNGIYEIETLIASGGMGEVYKGYTIHTHDPVAIKLLKPEFGANDAALALFRKEASALHTLHHDAIVRYYVCSVDPDLRRPYLAMEFVDGQSLSQLLRHGPLNFEAVRNLGQRLAAGLYAAHEHGIIHRDVAPDNVIIPGGDVGHAKIIDFGIARFTQTNDGTIIGGGFAGKYKYVSPEQLGLFGGDVTARSDIYSLGLLLVEALTGRPIDMGGSQAQVVEKRRKLPDLGGIDMRLRPLIERMLQPDPANRPDSMNAVAAMISGASAPAGSAVVAPSSAEPPKGTKSSRWIKIAAAASILLAAAAAGTVYVWYEPATLAPPSTPPVLQAGNMAAPGAAPPAKPPAPQSQASLNPPAAPALQPGSAGQLSRIRSITQYVNDYDGGECFFVTPISVGETAARIEGYGASVVPFQTLDSDFKKTNGFEADIGIRQVTPKQCPAITFLGQLRAQRNAAPQLDIGQTNLRSGGVLTGTIDGYGNRHVELVLVSDDGSVNGLTSLIKTNVDRKSFSLRMQINGTSTAQPQLLMAIVTAKPLSALQTSQPADASQVFPAALAEAARTGQTIGAAARYFKLE